MPYHHGDDGGYPLASVEAQAAHFLFEAARVLREPIHLGHMVRPALEPKLAHDALTTTAQDSLAVGFVERQRQANLSWMAEGAPDISSSMPALPSVGSRIASIDSIEDAIGTHEASEFQAMGADIGDDDHLGAEDVGDGDGRRPHRAASGDQHLMRPEVYGEGDMNRVAAILQ